MVILYGMKLITLVILGVENFALIICSHEFGFSKLRDLFL